LSPTFNAGDAVEAGLSTLIEADPALEKELEEEESKDEEKYVRAPGPTHNTHPELSPATPPHSAEPSVCSQSLKTRTASVSEAKDESSISKQENVEDKDMEDLTPTKWEQDRSVTAPSERVVIVVPEIKKHNSQRSLSPDEEKESHHQEDEAELKPVGDPPSFQCAISQSKTTGQISDAEKEFWARKRREQSKYKLSELDRARFKLIAHKLYEKYLQESSPLEINISSEQRARHRAYDRMDYMTLMPKDWVRLFDDVLDELEPLIVQSYKRMILKMDKVG